MENNEAQGVIKILLGDGTGCPMCVATLCFDLISLFPDLVPDLGILCRDMFYNKYGMWLEEYKGLD